MNVFNRVDVTFLDRLLLVEVPQASPPKSSLNRFQEAHRSVVESTTEENLPIALSWAGVCFRRSSSDMEDDDERLTLIDDRRRSAPRSPPFSHHGGPGDGIFTHTRPSWVPLLGTIIFSRAPPRVTTIYSLRVFGGKPNSQILREPSTFASSSLLFNVSDRIRDRYEPARG